ncbi:MAG: tetratricopeptide repeat protein [Alphaproteobacteria bacterium]|jgi:thioredoxin-like negative regulator of GroEL|nr:tetratricopeptide repeat protein [Alphaproteobacteria bacterium]
MYKTFIIILFLGLLPCTAHAQNTLADDLATARKLAEDQKYDDALTLLKKLQDNNPDNVELHLAIARTLSWSGNPDAAQIEIDKLSPVYPVSTSWTDSASLLR